MASSSKASSSLNRSLSFPSGGMRSSSSSAMAGPSTSLDTDPAAPSSSRVVENMLDPSRRKKRKQRGREMLVKVYYTLSSPRFNPQQGSPHPPPSPLPRNSSFLTVLDPQLAPSPASSNHPASPQPDSAHPPQQSCSCLARLSSRVFVHLLGPAPTNEDAKEFGKLTLKTCLSAICISRPELVDDATKDYAVSAMDPYEASLMPQGSTPSANGQSAGQHLMEGKGMLSWNLAEKHKGTTWVCGKVTGTPGRSALRAKADDGPSPLPNDDEEDDEDSEDDMGDETLEVHLQLVERPSFTQTQFLTSLRSFAQPAPNVNNSDKASSPVRRPPIATAVSAPVKPVAGPPGDPTKRKRPRESLLAARPIRSSASMPVISELAVAATVSAAEDPLAALKDPQVLTLLGQLLPSLGGGPGGGPGAGIEALAGADLASVLRPDQAKALMPALRNLAKFYGTAVPAAAGGVATASKETPPPPPPPKPDPPVPTGRMTRQQNKPRTRSATSSDPAGAPSSTPAAASTSKLVRDTTQFEPIPVPADRKDHLNPVDRGGCPNCKRKKSTVWREKWSKGEHITACNACGLFYNRHGYHRTKATATSPVRQPVIEHSTSTRPSKGRPLKGRLTATCESDLKKIKQQRRQTVPGIMPPPSPSKHVGPTLRSPTSVFRGGGGNGFGPKLAMTSPGRSPRRINSLYGFPSTSPLHKTSRRSPVGLGGGYDSDGGARVGNGAGYDFAAMFGNLNQSPSPAKRTATIPSYLLTASPGTALDRILNDTSCDMNSFDMSIDEYPVTRSASRRAAEAGMGHAPGSTRPSTPTAGLGDAFGDGDLSFFLRSSPLGLDKDKDKEKENTRPRLDRTMASSSTGLGSLSSTSGLNHLLPTTDGPSTEYDSLMSDLRQDFSNKFSSNEVTAPSSPPGSSPCVQPRTSQATPGTKGKAPQSCGRAAPSIHDSFIDSLEPHMAMPLAGATPASEDDAWAGGGVSRTMSYTDLQTGAVHQTDPMSGFEFDPVGGGGGNGDLFNLKASRKNLFGSRVFGEGGSSGAQLGDAGPTSDFDFNELPPSSPPALPSEAFPTPEEDGYQSDTEDHPGDRTAQPQQAGADSQSALAALLQAYGGASVGAGGRTGSTTELSQMLLGHGNGKIELDRATVNQLLGMLSAQAGAERVAGGPGVGAVAAADIFGGMA